MPVANSKTRELSGPYAASNNGTFGMLTGDLKWQVYADDFGQNESICFTDEAVNTRSAGASPAMSAKRETVALPKNHFGILRVLCAQDAGEGAGAPSVNLLS